MKRLFSLIAAGLIAVSLMLLTFQPAAAQARTRLGHFADAQEFWNFVDQTMRDRDFIRLIVRLGGPEDLGPSQLMDVAMQWRGTFPVDYANAAPVAARELQGGFSIQVRAYWSGDDYAYVRAVLHRRDDGVAVIGYQVTRSFEVAAGGM